MKELLKIKNGQAPETLCIHEKQSLGMASHSHFSKLNVNIINDNIVFHTEQDKLLVITILSHWYKQCHVLQQPPFAISELIFQWLLQYYSHLSNSFIIFSLLVVWRNYCLVFDDVKIALLNVYISPTSVFKHQHLTKIQIILVFKL